MTNWLTGQAYGKSQLCFKGRPWVLQVDSGRVWELPLSNRRVLIPRGLSGPFLIKTDKKWLILLIPSWEYFPLQTPQWKKTSWNSDGEKVDSRREKSLGILCQKFLMLLLVSPEVNNNMDPSFFLRWILLLYIIKILLFLESWWKAFTFHKHYSNSYLLCLLECLSLGSVIFTLQFYKCSICFLPFH